MKKGSSVAKLIFKGVVITVCIAALFALIVYAIITEFNSGGNKEFALLNSNVKYVVVGFALLILIALIAFVCVAYRGSFGADLATPKYFGIDFKKEEREREPMRSVEVRDRVTDALKTAKISPETVFAGSPSAPAPAPAVAKQAAEAESEEVNEDGSRFYMLTEIDKEYEHYVKPNYNNEIGLKELCEVFREYSSGQLKLYYDIEDIRRFIGALAVTKLIILQGMSGTGKTSLAYAFGEFLDNKTVVVPIQPMWKERTDLVGYYNEFTR